MVATNPSDIAAGAGGFDPYGPDFRAAVQLIIDRHAAHAPEADIRAAIGSFLIFTGLASADDLRREQDRIDLQSSDLIIETKRRIGSKAGFYPAQDNVRQLDDYMEASIARGDPRRLGVLTDGRYWLLRLYGVEEVNTAPPFGFELRRPDDGILLYEWLHDELGALEQEKIQPTEENVRGRLGPGLRFDYDVETLRRLHAVHRADGGLRVKQDLWRNLLAAALGEAVEENPNLDRLFLLHTYLSAVVGLALQSSFGVDIRGEAAIDPVGLLSGRLLEQTTGIRGVVESDFFAWPVETEEGADWLASLAVRVDAFDWGAADYDFARVLYQSVIPEEDRRQLGEYYTPDWLAEAVLAEVVPDPLDARVLDPACGSGTFLRAAIRRYIQAAREAGWEPGRIVDGLRQSVIGVDLHPVSVHLARATWLSAARSVIIAAGMKQDQLTIPIYLGDALQLRTDNGNLLGETQVTITVPPESGGKHRMLQFPRSLVDQGDWFDDVMLRIASAIETGGLGQLALDEADIPTGPDRDILEETVRQMEELHAEGRNHIWAYYTRNLVRPIWLSTDEGKVDAIVGNPPWITYSRAKATVREELAKQSKEQYRIWAGGRYAPHQDISGLFYARCVDLYLRKGGNIGMVMPHSALFAGQFTKWRSGEWGDTGADMSVAQPWDLERVEPNTFFPVPACAVFARKVDASSGAKRMSGLARRWRGPAGGPLQYETVPIEDTSGEYRSPYGERASNGATIVPRVLFFVEASELETSWREGLCQIAPRRSAQEKEPWRSFSNVIIKKLSGPMEEQYVYDVHLGETLAPYCLLDPVQALLPMEERHGGIVRADPSQSTDAGGVEAITLEPMRMRPRWRLMCDLWEENKSVNNQLSLLEQIDYFGKLTTQTQEKVPIRLVYSSSGRPTAAVLDNPEPLVDNTLFWIACRSDREAYYLAAVINSATLERAVEPLMTKGQFGARHLQKHLWRLPIPEYDESEPSHGELAALGKKLTARAERIWSDIAKKRTEEGRAASGGVARRELRKWMENDPQAQLAEEKVARLLA